jgi:hypothetical protein
MANEEKLRSELRQHIENEMKKANSEDDLTHDEIAKSSLFANELRDYLKSPRSIIEENVKEATAQISIENEMFNVWDGIPAEPVNSREMSDSFIEDK